MQSVKEQVTHPLRMMREALEPNSEAVKLLGQLFSGMKPLLEVVSMGRAPESALNVPIGPHRRFEMVQLSLAEVKQVRAALGGTVNDVILAVVAGALRTWLSARGDGARCGPARAGAGQRPHAGPARVVRQPGLRRLLPDCR